MECSICGIRSAVGYCVVCQTMLCEECGIACETCGKIACNQHVHETRSGRRLCFNCQKERKKERRARERGAETAAAGASAEESDGGGAVQDEVLAESARREIQPWLWSLSLAIAGIVLVVALMIFPTLRRAPLGGGYYIPTSIAPFVLGILAIAWGVVGLIRDEYHKDRTKSLAGAVVAVVAMLLSVVVVLTDPARNAKSAAEMMQQRRDGMTQQELDQWREQKLKTPGQPGRPVSPVSP